MQYRFTVQTIGRDWPLAVGLVARQGRVMKLKQAIVSGEHPNDNPHKLRVVLADGTVLDMSRRLAVSGWTVEVRVDVNGSCWVGMDADARLIKFWRSVEEQVEVLERDARNKKRAQAEWAAAKVLDMEG